MYIKLDLFRVYTVPDSFPYTNVANASLVGRLEERKNCRFHHLFVITISVLQIMLPYIKINLNSIHKHNKFMNILYKL